MAIQFPSEEWIKELAQRLNNDPEYRKRASKWEGTFVFHIKEEEGLLDEEHILWMDPWHGEVRQAKQLSSLEDETVNYGLAAKYSIWKKVLSGEMDSTKAMLTGKLKVMGKLSYIMRQKRAGDVVTKTAKMIEVDFV